MILAVVVTEAELAELEAAHLRSLGLDAGTADAPQVTASEATEEARRSLVARGLLTPGGVLAEPGTDVEVGGRHAPSGDLRLVLRTALDVRSAAGRTVVVERLLTAPGSDRVDRGVRLVHLLDAVACVEDLLDDGARSLALALTADEVAGAVAEVLVPRGAAAGTGASRAARTVDPAALAELLDHPTVLGALTVVDGPGEPVDDLLLALGPRGCWGADRLAGGDLVFRPLDPARLGEWVRSVQGSEGRSPGRGRAQ